DLHARGAHARRRGGDLGRRREPEHGLGHAQRGAGAPAGRAQRAPGPLGADAEPRLVAAVADAALAVLLAPRVAIADERSGLVLLPYPRRPLRKHLDSL